MSYVSATVEDRVAVQRALIRATVPINIHVSGGQQRDLSVIDPLLKTVAQALDAVGVDALEDGQTVINQGSTATVGTANGAVSVSGTISVSGGTPKTTLPGSSSLVSNGQVLTVTGGKVTLAVANGVITATYAAS